MKTDLQICLIIFLICVSCTSNRLNEALSYSGNNRMELEKILQHYSSTDNDELKLEASKFLIENMPGHYSSNDEITSGFFRKLDSLHPSMDKLTKHTLHCLPMYHINAQYPDELLLEDIKCITSNFLITHIDRAFHIWRTTPWHDDISFETFCKYILPYRMGDEPLEYIMRDTIPLLLDDISKALIEYKMPMHELREVYITQLLPHSEVIENIPEPLGPEYVTDCVSDSYRALLAGRLIGIPMAIDYAPHWSNRNGRHYWNCIIDPFMKKSTIAEPTSAKNAKIYRDTYHHNRIPKKEKKTYIPELFRHPFNEDVTDLYLNTRDVEVVCSNLPYHVKNVYLSVFNNLRWQPVAWSDNRNGKKVAFSKMGLGCIYQPIYYSGYRELSAGYPIKLDAHGRMEYMSIDKSHPVDMILKRKYPLNGKKINWSTSLQGTLIVASNEPTFTITDTLAVINQIDMNVYYSATISTTKKYRYWKIINSNRNIQLSEIEIIIDEQKWLEIMHNNAQHSENIDLLFDGDLLTFTRLNKFVVLDLLNAKTISEVRLYPRNDDNYIIPGNEYELFYRDIEGWCSVGKQIATNYYLKYTDVPSHGVYCLRNHTRGIEERIFTYENDNVVFW